VKPRKVEVVIPPSPKFRAIEESDEYQPSSSPAAPRQAKPSKSYGRVIKILVFVSACERCKRGKRDCVVDELGASCMGCKARKYGCSHTGKKDLKTMVVTRSVDESEEEEEEEEAVEEKKGKKRAAEPPARSKKVVKAKEVKEEKPKAKPKPRPKPKPKPTEKKSKGKERGSDEEEEDAMQVDDDESDEGEPKQKRPRLMHGEHLHKNTLTFS
jgi:type IV secretory pathway VirB10-like protein